MNMTNLMVTLGLTAFIMSATVPTIVASKNKAVGIATANYEAEMTGALEDFKVEIEENQGLAFNMNMVVTEAGYGKLFKDFAFKGKTPRLMAVSSLRTLNIGDTTNNALNQSGGWDVVYIPATETEAEVLEFRADFDTTTTSSKIIDAYNDAKGVNDVNTISLIPGA